MGLEVEVTKPLKQRDQLKVARLQNKKETGFFAAFGKSAKATAEHQIPSAIYSVSAIMNKLDAEALMEDRQLPSQTMAASLGGIGAALPSEVQRRAEYREKLRNPDFKKQELAKARKQWMENFVIALEENEAFAAATKDLPMSLSNLDSPDQLLGWLGATMGQMMTQIPAGMASMGTFSFIQEAGSIYLAQVQATAEQLDITPQEVILNGQDEESFALAFGFAAGALDAFGLGAVVGSLGKKFGRSALKKHFIGQAAGAFGRTSGIESATEGAQTVLEIVGEKLGVGSVTKDDFSLLSAEQWGEVAQEVWARRAEVIDASAAGAAGVAPIGGAATMRAGAYRLLKKGDKKGSVDATDAEIKKETSQVDDSPAADIIDQAYSEEMQKLKTQTEAKPEEATQKTESEEKLNNAPPQVQDVVDKMDQMAAKSKEVTAEAEEIHVQTRDDVKQGLATFFNLSEEQAETSTKLVHAVANAWARQRGAKKADWFNHVNLTLTQEQSNDPTALSKIYRKDGRTIVAALNKPDVASFVHELAHIIERDLPSVDKKTVVQWATGKESGKMTKAVREKFADGFEKYLATGNAPTSRLQVVFERFKRWISDIYEGIVGSEMDVELSPEITDVFSGVFSQKRNPELYEKFQNAKKQQAAEAQAEQRAARAEETAKKPVKTTKKEPTQKTTKAPEAPKTKTTKDESTDAKGKGTDNKPGKQDKPARGKAKPAGKTAKRGVSGKAAKPSKEVSGVTKQKEDAKAVRKDEGRVQETGTPKQSGKKKGGKDIQQPAKAKQKPTKATQQVEKAKDTKKPAAKTTAKPKTEAKPKKKQPTVAELKKQKKKLQKEIQRRESSGALTEEEYAKRAKVIEQIDNRLAEEDAKAVELAQVAMDDMPLEDAGKLPPKKQTVKDVSVERTDVPVTTRLKRTGDDKYEYSAHVTRRSGGVYTLAFDNQYIDDLGASRQNFQSLDEAIDHFNKVYEKDQKEALYQKRPKRREEDAYRAAKNLYQSPKWSAAIDQIRDFNPKKLYPSARKKLRAIQNAILTKGGQLSVADQRMVGDVISSINAQQTVQSLSKSLKGFVPRSLKGALGDLRSWAQKLDYVTRFNDGFSNAIGSRIYWPLMKAIADSRTIRKDFNTGLEDIYKKHKLSENNDFRIQAYATLRQTVAKPGEEGYTVELVGNAKKIKEQLKNKELAVKRKYLAGMAAERFPQEKKAVLDLLTQVVRQKSLDGILSDGEQQALAHLDKFTDEIRADVVLNSAMYHGRIMKLRDRYAPTRALGNIKRRGGAYQNQLKQASKELDQEVDEETENALLDILIPYQSGYTKRKTMPKGAYYDGSFMSIANDFVSTMAFDQIATPVIRTASKMFAHNGSLVGQLDKLIDRDNTNAFRKHLVAAIKSGAGRRVIMPKLLRSFESVKNTTYAAVLGNVTQSAKQLLAMVPAIVTISSTSSVLKAAKFIHSSNQSDFNQWLDSVGAGVQHRDAAFERHDSMDDILRSGLRQKYTRSRKKLENLTLKWLTSFDKQAANLGLVASLVEQGADLNNPTTEQIIQAERDVQQLQNTHDQAFASELFQNIDNPSKRLLLSTFLAFKSFAINTAITMLDATTEAVGSGFKNKRANRMAAASALNIAVFQAVSQGIYTLISKITGDDDEDKNIGFWEKVGWSTVVDMATGWMPGGVEQLTEQNIVYPIIESIYADDKGRFDPYTDSPVYLTPKWTSTEKMTSQFSGGYSAGVRAITGIPDLLPLLVRNMNEQSQDDPTKSEVYDWLYDVSPLWIPSGDLRLGLNIMRKYHRNAEKTAKKLKEPNNIGVREWSDYNNRLQRLKD
jgi:hypothetical protein